MTYRLQTLTNMNDPISGLIVGTTSAGLTLYSFIEVSQEVMSYVGTTAGAVVAVWSLAKLIRAQLKKQRRSTDK